MSELDGARVRDLMVATPITVPADAPAREALRAMGERGVGSVLVVEGERVVGIFTERDNLRLAAHDGGWLDGPVSAVMTSEPLTIEAESPWSDALDRMSERRIRHLPVVADGALVGVLSMRDLGSHRTGVLQALVRERTRALDAQNALLRQRDEERSMHLEIAARIQRRLLPPAVPRFEPYRFAVCYEPHHEVGGDYYDFARLDDDNVAFLIADVSGHGIPAALCTVMAKTIWATEAARLRSPAAVLARMNEHLSGLLDEEFITMIAGRIDRAAKKLVWARAGHPQPLFYGRASNAVRELEAEGVLLGVMRDATFTDESVPLRPGDRVLFYTDGLSEARDATATVLGTQRLAAALREHASLDAEPLLEALLEAARRHGRGDFTDDVTALTVAVG